ncbi:lactonizing lipase [Acinetobacter baumannii UH7807]|uniref:Triacylglycerol lipase n=27 Tax=Gammaproteobacteria TaxID=1236 RepID=A0ABX6CKD6_ACIB2|nr:triacylglycerol lipase [Acinetobacter baumannii]ACC58669.1 predicted acetyltransferase and hydrolase with the alpha/beta hydrolase fold [Acinetobacter baumannii ACICU]ACJ42975.1 lipase [Acinetobacter baumannii AB0057]ADX05042.1 Lipase [Acinetobacter baumannii 1656-2]ADX93989.1 acetyltransferase and hydrolase with the alpha/beta hydrolase fold [Acinetobacter baumannii TCDC-AB0715]AFI93993.1 putative acetyltransferase/hydrolase with alpha/beta hydrolase fold [Acinetobacter baumannii MDR-TJ]A
MKRNLIFFCAAILSGLSVSATHATNAEQVKSSFVYSTYAQTKYPLVFNHGMAGFNRVGTDTLGLDYWYQILPDLARNGGNVWATRVSPFNSTEVRGEQLAQQVEEIIAITGKPKVNLIGHSHGGPTIRYVAGIMPEKVASLTTIGAPHKGSPMADVILNVEGTPLSGLATLVNWFSAAITWAGGLDPNSYPHDSLAGAHSLSTQGSAQFNSQFPMGVPTTSCGEGAYQEKGIYMYSFSGNKALTNPLDPFDIALTGSSLVVDPFGDNDGLVSRCSAKFGKTIRDDYNWNHLDEVNQVMGIRSIFAADPVSVYRQHANRLKLQGL